MICKEKLDTTCLGPESQISLFQPNHGEPTDRHSRPRVAEIVLERVSRQSKGHCLVSTYWSKVESTIHQHHGMYLTKPFPLRVLSLKIVNSKRQEESTLR